MRGFLSIIGLAALLIIGGGFFAVLTGFPASSVSNQTSAPLPTAVEDHQLVDPPVTSEPVAQGELPEIDVQAPRMELVTTGLERIEEQYSEVHTFDDGITVRWRPGAYPAERAEEVARLTREAFVKANENLQTDYHGPVEILLADQLFIEDCMGCQGFTAADQNRIFMLDDGSVVDDEWEALLVHEVTHLIAAKEIFLPLDLFFAEGLATWSMSDDLVANGYLSPVQTAAWTYRAGAMPSLADLFNDDFAGRMRKRVSYDAAGSFVAFLVDTYGWHDFRRIYTRDPIESVAGKTLSGLEQEWHAYLDQVADKTVAGVGAEQWWSAAEQVIAGFVQLYQHGPASYTADQYRELTLSRLALNRGWVDAALEHLAASGHSVTSTE